MYGTPIVNINFATFSLFLMFCFNFFIISGKKINETNKRLGLHATARANDNAPLNNSL